MNTQIGKSFGIALLLAVGAIAVMLAWSPFTTRADVAETAVTAVASSHAKGATDLTLDITITLSGTDVDDKIDVKFLKKNEDAPFSGTPTVTGTWAGKNIPNNKVTLPTNNGFTITQPAAVDTGQRGRVVVEVTGLTPVTKAGGGPYTVTATQNGETGTAMTTSTGCDDTYISSCEPGAAVRIELEGTADKAVGVNEDIEVDLKGFNVPETIGESQVLVYNDKNIARNPVEVSTNGTTVTVTLPNFADPTQDQIGLIDKDDYSIVFKQSAGITNPASAGTLTIKVTDNDVGETEDHEVTIQRVVKLSKTSGKRGTETVATLKGFANDTATVSLMVGTTTSELDQVEITDNAGTLTIDTTSDKFEAGEDANRIIVTDSEGIREDVPGTFTISPTVIVDPTETSVSKNVKVMLSDWTEGVVISEVKIGNDRLTPDVLDTTTAATDDYVKNGLPADADDRDIGSDGKLTLDVTVRAGVNRGSQTIKVSGSNGKTGDAKIEESATASLKIGVLSLTITPSSVVPGQQITIRGSGFLTADEVDSIMIGGKKADLSDDSDGDVTSAGRIAVTTDVPLAVGNGEKKVIVKVGEREGNAKITVPKPSITVDPEESLIGSTITVSGTGFAASGRVEVLYDGKIEDVGRADSNGNVNVELTVPSDAGIGETNPVKVEVRGQATINASADHKTPGSVLTSVSSPVQAGGEMTVSGINFQGFSTLKQVTIGGHEALPSPAPETDRKGQFEFTVRVPLLSVGNHTVTVVDGSENSATETFRVSVEPVVVEPVVTDPAELFAGLGDRLLRVWEFDNDSQTWSFYDPRPNFEDFNSLTEVSSGDIATIIISSGAPIAFQGTNLYPGGTSVVVLK